jgi:hypothetical protein
MWGNCSFCYIRGGVVRLTDYQELELSVLILMPVASNLLERAIGTYIFIGCRLS